MSIEWRTFGSPENDGDVSMNLSNLLPETTQNVPSEEMRVLVGIDGRRRYPDTFGEARETSQRSK